MPPLGWSLALLWLGALVGFCMAALLCASGQASRDEERREGQAASKQGRPRPHPSRNPKMTTDSKCSKCGSYNTVRSLTGDWCNDCGWAYPGLKCLKCGRTFVNRRHRTPDGEWCEVSSDDTEPCA